MKKEYKIRKTEPKDAEQHVRLGLSVWRCAYKNIFPEEVFIDKENKAEDKIKNFDKSIQNDNMSLSYVAESDGKIVVCECVKIMKKALYIVLSVWRRV